MSLYLHPPEAQVPIELTCCDCGSKFKVPLAAAVLLVHPEDVQCAECRPNLVYVSNPLAESLR